MIIIIKNTTSSDIFLSDVGTIVFANSSFIVDPVQYPYWANSLEIIPYIKNRSLIVNDNTADLDIDEGIDYITTTPFICSYDNLIPGKTIVVFKNQQHIAYQEIEVQNNATMVIDGTLIILE